MKTVFCVAISAVLLAGCATVTRGANDAFSVNTDPSGASVRTSNQFACDATPCTFKMSRKAEFSVTITKPGYKTWTGQVTHKVATAGGAGMAGNVLLGGLIGAGVDVATGAMMDLVPNPLNVKLEQEAPGPVVAVSAPMAVSAPVSAAIANAPVAAAAPAVAAGLASAEPRCGMIRQRNGVLKMVPC